MSKRRSSSWWPGLILVGIAVVVVVLAGMLSSLSNGFFREEDFAGFGWFD